MKRIAITVGVILLLASGVGAWWWSLGSVPSSAPQEVVLRVERGGVEVKRAGSEEWRSASDRFSLSEADEVRTDATGRAAIRFFNVSEVRLRENSSLAIETASFVPDRPTTAVIRLRLMGGRIWSRVLRLFDLDSAFSVRTDTVIATVRGTAFDMSREPTGTAVLVSDSAVRMAPSDEREESGGLMVSEGFMARRSDGGEWTPAGRLGSEETESEWFRGNVQADRAFTDDVKLEVEDRLRARTVARPDHALFGLARLSEQLHLAVAGDGRAELYGRIVAYRLYGITSLLEDGKSGLAFQAFTSLEQELKNESPSPYLRRAAADVEFLFEDVGPDSPLYRMKQRLEDVSQAFAASDAAATLFQRIRAADSRLKETASLLDAGKLDEARTTLDAARQGMQNIERDLETGTGIASDHEKTLREKDEALRVRERELDARLMSDLAPEPATAATSTTVLPVATSTPEIAPPPVPTPPAIIPVASPPDAVAPPPVEAPWDTITLTATPNPVEAGQTAQLRVIGSRSDGTTADLTSLASFALFGNLGSLNGPSYQSSVAGSVTVEAAVLDHGVNKTARTSITVLAPVVLTSLTLTPNGGTSLRTGQTVSLTATAVYSSGLTKLVTPSATWMSSDSSIASVSLGTVIGGSKSGTATITAAYSEGGKTVTAALDVPVTSSFSQ
ncbi:FecR domain-containing protein [Candidatus Uhrbacteria bacterium]|nr:FecR domain-containing protein [Candidatus Uhrbacteria bacterium]